MEIRDLNIIAALLCQEGVNLKGYKIRKGKEGLIFYFQLDGKSKEEFNQMILNFWRNKLQVPALTFSKIRDFLLDIIKKYGLKAEHQLGDGELIGEVTNKEEFQKTKSEIGEGKEVPLSEDIQKKIEKLKKEI